MSDWSATLTVGVDEPRGLLTPRLRVQGRSGFIVGSIRVELVDELGAARGVVRRPLLARSLDTELIMPSLAVPEAANTAEVLRWPWDIVLEGEGSELVRWRRYLSAATPINAEGELELRGSRDPRRAKEEAEGKGPEAPWNERDSERLLDVLMDDGELTERDRDALIAARTVTGKTVERALIDRGWLDERELLAIYAELTGTEFIDLAECGIDPAATSLIPAEISLRYGLIAVGFRGDDLLTVAMSDPQHPRAVVDIEAATWRRVYVVVATRQDILTALEEDLGLPLPVAELNA